MHIHVDGFDIGSIYPAQLGSALFLSFLASMASGLITRRPKMITAAVIIGSRLDRSEQRLKDVPQTKICQLSFGRPHLTAAAATAAVASLPPSFGANPLPPPFLARGPGRRRGRWVGRRGGGVGWKEEGAWKEEEWGVG